ncbi:MAG: tetratricopeptide repeat protein [Candidatus Methylacidiphilales bacterium]|nr:tetratricopeptide repeat protein [Candidatus Methylacidiphilales bacterium]
MAQKDSSLQDQVRLAQQIIAMGELDRALDILDQIEAAHPGHCDALILRASLLLKKKDLASARTVLDRVESLHPGLTVHAYNRAEWHFIAHEFPRALELFQSIGSDFPQPALVSYKIALCQLMMGNKNDEDEHADSTADVAPSASWGSDAYRPTPRDPAPYFLHAARLLIQNRDPAHPTEALALLRAAGTIYPYAVCRFYGESLVSLGLIPAADLPLASDVPRPTMAMETSLPLPDLDIDVQSLMNYASRVPLQAAVQNSAGSAEAGKNSAAIAELPGLAPRPKSSSQTASTD